MSSNVFSLGGAMSLFLPVVTLAQAPVYESAEHSFRVVTVAEGLQHPWSIAFLPDGDVLVTERPGRLRIIRDDKLLPFAVDGVPEVRSGNQGGLHEVLPHPDFENNRLLYLSFATSRMGGAEGSTRVVRGRFQNDRLTDVEEIFLAEAWVAGQGHYGGKLAFDDEGYLFVTVGDRQVPPTGDLDSHPAQDRSNHQGTISRLHDDGSIPDDNPFVGHGNFQPSIWSYGHRNPQGLAIHPETGDIWSTEHGPQGGDELNVILPGVNYGWPVIGYGVNYRSGTPIHASNEREGMAQPAAFWIPSIGASGLMIYDGDLFPEWRGNIFAAGLATNHRRLTRFVVDGTRVMTREPLMLGDYRIRDVRQSPDGYIYIAEDHRGGDLTRILRMEPVD
ncbi:MAG TPA: PQQ-dependent sugar dehydrogenase [Gammaproteobacteria bacterium]